MQILPPQASAQPPQSSPAGPGGPQAPSGPQGAPAAGAQPTPSQLPPPLSSIAAGELPALRFPPEPKNRSLSPLSQYVAQNLDTIARAGIDFCELKDRQSVLFNPVKTNKAAILKLEAEGKLDHIPEVKPLTLAKQKPAGVRTVHTAPAGALGGQGPQMPPQGPTNGAGAPVAPAGSGSAGDANPPAPDGPVKIDKKLLGERISALKQNDTRDSGSLPATTLSKLSKRAI